MATGDFDPERLLTVLHQHGVSFVLIGGMAAILHGDPGMTVDLDVVPERTDDNLERLATALRAMNARIRTEGEPKGLPFDCSRQFFKNLPPDSFVNMTTDAGDIDVTFQPAGTAGFAGLASAAHRMEAVDQVEVLVASLEDIIRSKEAADRDKDRSAVPRLRQLLERIRRSR